MYVLYFSTGRALLLSIWRKTISLSNYPKTLKSEVTIEKSLNHKILRCIENSVTWRRYCGYAGPRLRHLSLESIQIHCRWPRL